MTTWDLDSIRRLGAALGVLEPERHERGPDARELERAAAELAAWAHGRVAVVVPDATRLLPAGVVAACLDVLRGHELTVVVGTGLHRPPSDAEWRSAPHLVEVLDAGRPVEARGGLGESVVVGERGGVEVAYVRAVVEADCVVTFGTVELHQYAGFSGGVKGVAVGCASADTIGWIHRPALLRDPALGVGIVDGNPFRSQLDGLVAALPPLFEVQGVLGRDARWRLFAGPSPGAWRAAVSVVDAFWDTPAPAAAAAVGVAGAKAANLYQASRGVTQLVLQAGCPLEPDAPVVLVTEAPDGLGEGQGELAFAAALERGRARLLGELAGFDDGARTGGGTQRAYIVALTSARHPVGYVALEEAPELTRFGWRYLASEADARAFLGTDAYLRVPDPLHVLPRLPA